MNWEMIGAIGEILGAVGVIVTVAYLAIQMRENTRALRLESRRESFDGARALLAQMTADDDLARIFRTGLEGMEQLEPDEALRFGAFMLSTVYQWVRVDTLYREGTVEREFAEATARVRRDVVTTPGFRQWYGLRKHWLPEAFRDTLEAEMADSTAGYLPYPSGPA